MEFKWISAQEFERLNTDEFDKRGWTPLPNNAIVYTAFDEKGIAGFNVLRVVPHAEPLWVRLDMRGKGLALELVQGVAQMVKDTDTHGVFVIADNPSVVKLCREMGMRLITSPVYIKD